MKSPEMFLKKSLATGMLILAGGLALSACETTENPPENGQFTENHWERNLDNNQRVWIGCEDNTLVKKLQKDGSEDTHIYEYLDHPACDDKKVDVTDTFDTDLYVNEYTVSYPQAQE